MVSHGCHELCADKPDSELSYPFGNETAVYKVNGKMFAAIGTDEAGVDRITLKCEPERAEVLVGEHEHIEPGYHMNKRHWVTVYLNDTIERTLLEDLIDDSYLLVRGKRKKVASTA